jgi:hypothetical protein
MVPTPEERIRLASEALEELVLLAPDKLSLPEALLWATLLRAIPIRRTCASCSRTFYIAGPRDVRCPECEMQHARRTPVEQSQEATIPHLMLGVQTGLMRTRDALAQLRVSAPDLAQVLEEAWLTDRYLAEMSGQRHGTLTPAPTGFQDEVLALLRVVQTWMGDAESPE